MSHTVRVLCRPEAAAGFALTGLAPIEMSDAADGAARLRSLLGEPEVGVVLLEQDCYDALPEDVRRTVGRRPLPMVVPFPGPRWAPAPAEAESYIVELLRQVIGYRVRLR